MPATRSLAWATLAFALLLLWQFLNVHYNRAGNWTALFLTGTVFPVPPELAAGTYRFPGDGYDGQFYRYVAHDPWFQRGLPRYMDSPVTRYRRILVPALAFVLAAGRQSWIDGTYIVVNAIFTLLGAYWLSRWSARHGHHPAWGLVFLLVPATLISMDRMTVDTALAALTVAAVYYWETKSWLRLYAVLMLACLGRETGALLAAGCCIFELLQRRFTRSMVWASAVLPGLAWFVLVQHVLAQRRGSGLPGLFGAHGEAGLFGLILNPPRYPLPAGLEMFARSLDAVAMISLAGAFLMAILMLRIRPVSAAAISAVFFVVLAIPLLGYVGYWKDCNEYARVYSPLLILIALGSAGSTPGRLWWFTVSPVILMDLRLGIQFVSPIGGVLRGLLRL